ncbi:MAG: hypothetical protein FWE66_05590, partial [Oscillospiraceae bacterium]|nr:hypothetical protein [Oscillospiraceae bacterium]
MKIQFIESQKQKRKIKAEPGILPALPDNLAVYRTGRPGYIDMRTVISLLMPVALAIEEAHASEQTLPSLRPDAVDIIDRTLRVNSDALLYRGVIFPGFSAPEVYTGVTHGIPTDIYTFSALLFYLMTGSAPDNAYNRMKRRRMLFPKELYDEILGSKPIYAPNLIPEEDPFEPQLYIVEPLPVVPDDMIDRAFVSIIEKGMALDAADRFESMAEMIAALAPYNTKASIVYPVLMAVDDEDVYYNLIVSKVVRRKVKKIKPETEEKIEKNTSSPGRVRGIVSKLSEKLTVSGDKKPQKAEETGITAEKEKEQESSAYSELVELRANAVEDINIIGMESRAEKSAKQEHTQALMELLDEISSKKAEGVAVDISTERLREVWPDETADDIQGTAAVAESNEVALPDGKEAGTEQKVPAWEQSVAVEEYPYEELTDSREADIEQVVEATEKASSVYEARADISRAKLWQPERLSPAVSEPEAIEETDTQKASEEVLFQAVLLEALVEDLGGGEGDDVSPFLPGADQEAFASIEEVIGLSERLLEQTGQAEVSSEP